MFEAIQDEPMKPENWPANADESALQNIFDAIKRFIDEPNYKTKEVLISLVSSYDLNQKSHLGLFRITEYEVCLINTIYLYAMRIQFNTAKTYLYELVGERARLVNTLRKMQSGVNVNDDAYEFLLPSLKLYYWIYSEYNWYKNRSLADQMINNMNQIINNSSEDICNYYTSAFLTLLNDISYFRCKKKNNIWAFTREELMKLFEMQARIIKQNGENPLQRPLKGVLMTMLSNYILKSRYNYNGDYICKYVSKDVANSSAVNHEVWMQKTEFLNDKRELKVLPQLFSNKSWLKYDWAKNGGFEPVRIYYVSSFSKSLYDSMMEKKYGQCRYGYKDDRIAELLSPIHTVGEKKDIPQLGQVVSFDILYDEDLAKEEINYLCSIIDLFDLSDKEKSKFLSQIMQYWILSVKDKKWSYERERRYVLFLYDEYDYIELNRSDDRFLKLKSSLLIEPDFILGDNPQKKRLRMYNQQKRRALNVKDYIYCPDCFSCDFDLLYDDNIEKCPICNSSNIQKVCLQARNK
jgi:hypothetical protein